MDFKIEALLQKPSEVNSGTIYFIKENENVNLYLGTSDKKLQYIGQSLGDKAVLPKELQGKSIMEMFSYLFQYANSNKNKNNELKLLVGNAIGIDYSTKTNIEISNDIINQKDLIVKALLNKNIEAKKSDTLYSYANKINQITQDGKLQNTKLNVKAPYIKEIPLSKPIQIENLCTTVLEYVKGEENMVKYTCNFDNGDKDNFIYNNSIEYDGEMKQKNKIKIYKKEKASIINNKQEYITNIDLLDFYNIKQFNDISDDTKQEIELIGSYDPILVQAKNDIDLVQVDCISKVNWVGENVLLLFSLDSGMTWNSYNIESKKNIKIDINNNKDIKKYGLTITDVNSLKEEDLRILLDGNPKIRFAYYFDAKIGKKQFNDKISITVDMMGRSVISKNANIQLGADGQTIVYKIDKDGTYTVNYYDILQ